MRGDPQISPRCATSRSRQLSAKHPRFEVIKMKVPRGDKGSSVEVAKILSRKLKKTQRLIYLKHNTLVGNTAHWTAIVENVSEVAL